MKPEENEAKKPPAAGPARSRIEEYLLRTIRSVQFGSVEVVIHDSQVVRIERLEKFRLEPGEN